MGLNLPISKYLSDVQKQFDTGIAREHAYRPALKVLIEDICPTVTATNDPAHISCGAPDFILSKNKIDIGYIEAKDIGANLDVTEDDEQLTRYRESLDNLILTDYLEFRFYRDGEKVETIRVANLDGDAVTAIPENYAHFMALVTDFGEYVGQTITSPRKLATMMARKARLMCDVFFNVVDNTQEESSLHDQLNAFRRVLVHDMDSKQFADVYAQTIAYGLFTARLHDRTLETFSRSEAMDLIPKSNPFLRQLFYYVAGPDLDDRVVWIVDALCEVFRATNLKDVLKGFGTATGKRDPVLHFYETFLAEYDPALRKSRGIWFTPEPVVSFIVRGIDEVLRSDFELAKGLADASKIEIQLDTQLPHKSTKSERKTVSQHVHKLQLLDVATGTGTFLAEVIKQVYRQFRGQEGLWSRYVEEDLLPRLHGFELLMASYAMCHMKIDLLLQETGYKPIDAAQPPRVSVFLTNSLEEYHPDTHTLFASWLSREANEANRIKNENPIMVAFGNPPYSGHSSNKGEWLDELLEDYKKEPGGKERLKERNPKWLNDDYVKFIRLGEYYVAKNGEGILAYITNHSYLDNPTFRGMRWHLLRTFDRLYILDLHGNSKKKEKTPEGLPDKNVFDIQQGVSIIIALKRRNKSGNGKLADVRHADVWGSRENKYKFLEENSISSISWSIPEPISPDYFLVPKDYGLLKEYSRGFAINDAFGINSIGLFTAKDALLVDVDESVLCDRMEEFFDSDVSQASFESKYGVEFADKWGFQGRRDSSFTTDAVKRLLYRPFDKRYIYFDHTLIERSREDFMGHFLKGENFALITGRQGQVVGGMEWNLAFVTNELTDLNVFYRGGGSVFPLYRYDEILDGAPARNTNIDAGVLEELRKVVQDARPESTFDYIYGVLHSRHYRQKYAGFLKTGFPRIPYPTSAAIFQSVSELGGRLRRLHLMDDVEELELKTVYPVDGNHLVEQFKYKDEKVWINKTQFFGGVSEELWDFHIGGYQPAQKWLKDRRGRKLSIEEISQYQRIIVALAESSAVMDEIDETDFIAE